MAPRPATVIGAGGGVLAGGFSTYSMLRPITYEIWDVLNSVIYSAFIAALIVLAISMARSVTTIRDVATELVRASAWYGAIFVVAYWGTTTYAPNRIVQLPFFVKDYAYHGYVLPAAYLSAGSSYRQLLQLQIELMLVATVMQVAVGTGAAFVWRRWGPAPPALAADVSGTAESNSPAA